MAMLKYISTAVVFAEIPDEITLAVQISGCPNRCEGCHTPELRDGKGDFLTSSVLLKMISDHPDITCVCFMGGDAEHYYIQYLADVIHLNTNLKVGFYSGNEQINKELVDSLDYYKAGPYIEKLGPLTSTTTNQRLYKVMNDGRLQDITYKFWRQKWKRLDKRNF